jgi:hypothetical protein
MSLRDEILAVVRAEPGIQSAILCRRIGVTRDRLGHCLQRLRREGFIESTARGRYQIASVPPVMEDTPVKLIAIEPSSVPERAPAPGSDSKRHARYSPSTFISPPSRDRLMSGR